MNKVGDYINGMTPEEKLGKWVSYSKSRIDFLEKKAKIIKSRDVLIIAKLEFQGGECPKCMKEWKRIDFKNMFAEGTYYQPVCDCFVFCPYCESHLYDYEAINYLKLNGFKCPICGWGLLLGEGKSLNRRHGFETRNWLKGLPKRKQIELLNVGREK